MVEQIVFAILVIANTNNKPLVTMVRAFYHRSFLRFCNLAFSL
jgi:hypothetical protein